MVIDLSADNYALIEHIQKEFEVDVKRSRVFLLDSYKCDITIEIDENHAVFTNKDRKIVIVETSGAFLVYERKEK